MAKNPFPLSDERRREAEDWADTQRQNHGNVAIQAALDARAFDPKSDDADRDKRGRFTKKGRASDGKQKAYD